MKIVFFGTGNFGIPTLKRLLKSSYEVEKVVTRPDIRKGRGWNVLPTPVKEIVKKTAPGTDVLQPEKMSDPEFRDSLKSCGADVFVVVDYGKILTKEILSIPSKYCINLHPSLLPLYRGPAPVNRAIMAGDAVTGNTVIKMNERMDAGDILLREEVAIGEHDTADLLGEKLSFSGAFLVLKALDLIESGLESTEEQDETIATYAPKLEKSEGKIDWGLSADQIALKVRGLQPWPGAYTLLNGRTVKILQASGCEIPEGRFSRGEIIRADSRLVVNCGRGALRVAKLQMEGKKAMTSDEFLRGHRDLTGAIMG